MTVDVLAGIDGRRKLSGDFGHRTLDVLAQAFKNNVNMEYRSKIPI